MAATEISRTKSAELGAIFVRIDDGHGVESTHTYYVAGVPDINAAIEATRESIEQQADARQLAFEQAGL